MRKQFLLTIISLFLFLNVVQAQTINISQTPNYICKGTSAQISFSSSGTFEAGNVFKVQVRPYYGSSSNSWTDLVTEGVSSPLKFTLPESYDANNSSSGNYYFRIVATKPSINSGEYSATVYTKPTVNLVGATPLTINPFDQVSLLFTGNTSTSTKIVFDDSSSVNVSYLYSNSQNSVVVFPNASRDYKIAYVSNVCGRGTSTGSVKITVNEISLKANLISNASACIGNTIKIPVAANGQFNTANKFKIGLRQSSNSSEYEIDAIEKDGAVEAVIPNFIPTNNYYQVRIVSSSPKAISPWTNNYLTIGEKHSAEIVSASTSVDWGKSVDIQLAFTGVGPFNAVLNDGTAISYSYSGATSSSPVSSYNKITPSKTNSYKIASFTSGCGVGGAGKNTMNVTVKGGVKIDSLPQNLEICVKQPFKVKYSLASGVSTGSLSAFISNSTYSSQTRYKVSASFDNGIMTVTIPEDVFGNTTQYGDSYYLIITNTNGDLAYSDNYIRIKTIPKVTFYRNTDINLNTKGLANIEFNASGSGPFNVTFTDSTKVTFGSNYFYTGYATGSVPVIKTTTFKIKSVSNVCGINNSTNNSSQTVIIKNPANNDILIKNYPARICVAEKVKIDFNTLGTFDSNNEFKVELLQYDTPIAVLGTSKTNSVEASIPTTTNVNDYASYSIRVVSSNPTAVSDRIAIGVNRKPSASINSSNRLELNVLPNDNVYFSINKQAGYSGTNTYTFSDGSTVLGENISVIRNFAKSTTFSLVSVKNECGEGTVTGSGIKIISQPFKITSSSNFYDSNSGINRICANNLFTYQYAVTGNVDATTTYNLQIASTKDSVFKDLVTKTNENPISVKLPSTFTNGTYFLRLISNTTVPVSSPFVNVNVLVAPEVSLSATNGTGAVSVDGGSYANLRFNLKGGLPAKIIAGDNFNNNFSFSVGSTSTGYYDYQVLPTKTSTYTVKALENSCGYGSNSGSVKVTLNPSLFLQSYNFETCVGGDVSLNFSTYGEYESDNKFKFVAYNTVVENGVNTVKKYDLGEISASSTGIAKFKVPTTIPSGNYFLEISSTKPAQTRNYTNSYFNISNPLDVTITGSSNILAGQTGYVLLLNNNLKNNKSGVEPGTCTLSDGSRVQLYNYKTYYYVAPRTTTTYAISNLENACGKGKISGNAKITVIPTNVKSVVFDIYTTAVNSTLCSGAAYSLYYTTNGVFGPTNKFTAQLSDKNGENFKDIPTEGTKSPLKATVPDNLEDGDNYRFRIVASDQDAVSTDSPLPMSANKGPVATLDSTTYFFSEGKPVNVKVNLTGTPPWTVRFGLEELSAVNYRTSVSPFVIKLNPLGPIAYKVFGVYDALCFGKVSGTGIVKIELITANEELSDMEVKLFPNPTSDKITIQSDNFKSTTLQIFDNVGRQVLQQNITKSETVLDISDFKTGQYLLQIEREGKRNVYKIMKL
jgi:hypothetical protein